MRVAYTCHDMLPWHDTNTEQIFWTLVEVARLGHDIDFFIRAPPAAQPETDAASARRAIASYYGLDADRWPSRLRLVAVPTRPARGAAAMAAFDLTIAGRVRRGRYDLIWTEDMLALAGHLRSGVPTIFELYRTDINTKRRYRLWREGCYRRTAFAGVIAQSRLSQQSFVAAGVDERRALVVYNGFNPARMHPVRTRDEARMELALPRDQPTVVYTGHVSRMKATETLIPIAARLPGITFLVVGGLPESAEARWFVEQAQASRATNVRLVTHVAPSAVPAYLYAADCLVIPPASAPGTRYHRTVLPMKTFLYLAAGRTIVGPRLPDVEEILTDDHNALLVPPDDPDAAVAAVERVFESSGLRERLSRTALASAAAYTWQARAETIAPFLEARVAGGTL